MYDRAAGRKLNDGGIWLYGHDTLRFRYDTAYVQISPGKYIIEAWDVGYEGTKTKSIDFKENKKIEINFYLGTTVVN